MQKKCDKNVIISNVRRVCGQIQGVEKMIEEDRDIAELMQQVTAASSALNSIAKQLLKDYADGCFSASKKFNKQNLDKLIDQLFKNM